MRKLLAFALGSTALFGVSMTGSALAEADYPFAATGFFAGGAAFMDRKFTFGLLDENPPNIFSINLHPVEWLTLNGGGDFVLPLNGDWNVQLGGALRIDRVDIADPNRYARATDLSNQFQGGVIGFWRDPAIGVFGIEAGVYSRYGKFSTRVSSSDRGEYNSFKIGGVAEYFFSDMVTIGAYGGAILPFAKDPFGGAGNGKTIDTGYYAGGHLIFYASDDLAFAGFTQYLETNASGATTDEGGSRYVVENHQALRVGGKVRYLTFMPGVELFASGNYVKCEESIFTDEEDSDYLQEGAEFLAGVNIRLGGHTDSLVSIDRSNALDTRAWACANVPQAF